MLYYKNINLKTYNTFGLESVGRKLFKIRQEGELIRALKKQRPEYFILGGGSNVLLSEKIKSVILKNEIQGIKLVQEASEFIELSVGGGVNWHQFVLWCVQNNYGGIENLSLIPGTVGAAPIQNIGAYGVELESVFKCLEAIDLESGQKRIFVKDECEFGYRNSIFKQSLKGQYFITNVTFRLSTKKHKIHKSYGSIDSELKKRSIETPTIQDISNVVIAIRESKLPNPEVLGNSGSFFKNPLITQNKFEILKDKFPFIPSYPADKGMVKIPAAWLIDQAGWKGKRSGDAGTYKNQALVLVNHGNATSKQLIEFAEKIIDDVEAKYSIKLSPEVNIIR